MADQSKYYMVKASDVASLDWNKYKNLYIVAQKTYYNTINQKPIPGKDPMMIQKMAAEQFKMDCENIQKMYYDTWAKGYLPTPVTINGRQRNVFNGEEYILVKDPTPNIQDSFIDETGYDASMDRAIHDIRNKVQYNNFKSARLATQFWTN
jgi:hypothetical protein